MKFPRMMIAWGLVFLMLGLSSCASTPEAKSARFLDAGKKLLKNKDAARAILQFQNAVKAKPNNPEAYYQLGKAFLAAQDIPHGIAALRRAIELDPKHQNAELALARLMAMVHDKTILQDAEQRLRTILQDAPDNADALHSLALTELKLGDPEDAVRDLTHAMAAAPEQVMIAATLAQAKLQQKDVKGAEEVLKKACESSPKSTDARIVLGRFYLIQNRVADAEQQFRSALAIDASDENGLLSLGVLQNRAGRREEAEQTFRQLSKLRNQSTKYVLAIFLFQNGRKDEAVKEFERLAKEDPTDRTARTRLVTAYESVGRTADAEKLLATVLKKNPKDLDALLQRGELFLGSKRFNEAEADLNEVLHLQPGLPEVHYVLGKLCEARGDAGCYRQELSKALDQNRFLLPVRLELARAWMNINAADSALDLLGNTPAAQKDLPSVLVARNWALWAKGDMAGMRKGIDQGLSIERSPDLLLQDGAWKLRAGQFAAARGSLEQVLNINPADVRALGALNETYVAQKQGSVALERIKDYASRNPKAAAVQEFLGVMLSAGGDRAGARRAFEAARTADPKFVRADLSLAQLDIVDNKLDDAQRRLKAILTADQGNVAAKLWVANLELMKGDQKAAMADFGQVVQADANNVEALNNYAYLLNELTDHSAEALKYAQRAKELSPTHAAYGDTLGWILYRHGLYPQAVSELERAAGAGGDAVCNYHLAMAYAKAGHLDSGKKALRAALNQNPNLPEAKTAREMLGVSQ